MWKGYRDAECAFVESTEESSSSTADRPRRTALFLVIYAPKRALIEVGYGMICINVEIVGMVIMQRRSSVGGQRHEALPIDYLAVYERVDTAGA